MQLAHSGVTDQPQQVPVTPRSSDEQPTLGSPRTQPQNIPLLFQPPCGPSARAPCSDPEVENFMLKERTLGWRLPPPPRIYYSCCGETLHGAHRTLKSDSERPCG